MIKKTRKERKTAMPRVTQQIIDVSKIDLLSLSLVNGKGEELLSLDFDRFADEMPQIKIDVTAGSDVRRLKTGLVLFDVDA